MSEKEQKKGRKKKRRIWPYVFIATVLILFVIIYVTPAVTGAFEKTAILEYGYIEVSDDIECYFIRDEEIYYASGGGDVDYYYEEGSRIRKGTTVLTVGGRTAGNIAQHNGSVSYYIDGNEEYFNTANMDSLTKKQVEKMDIKVRNLVTDSAFVTSGDPLFKMVTNDTWYIAAWVSAENMLKYKEDSSVTVKLPMGDVRFRVVEIKEDNSAGDYWRIMLKTNRYYEDLGRTRKTEARVITSSEEGVMAENNSIVVENNQPGVYVKQISGDFKFVPVKIKAREGDYSLLATGTIEITGEDGQPATVNTVKAYDEIRR